LRDAVSALQVLGARQAVGKLVVRARDE